MSPSTARVLVATPVQKHGERPRLYGRALHSHFGLRWSRQLDYLHLVGGDDSDGNVNVTCKYQAAQCVFLDGEWDAMLCAEADMILPPDALERLASLQVDVAYGLYVWRHGKPEWNAYHELGVQGGKSYSLRPDVARAAWGTVQEVAGIGQGCTLIRRRVLEAIRFRNRRGIASDWTLALDAKDAGFTQLCDFGCVCGHMATETRVLWPDPNEPDLYRTEASDAPSGAC